MDDWKIIEGTNGRYSVSSAGQVRANWADVPRRTKINRVRIEKVAVLAAYLHTNGYWRINLGRKNRHYVHRLVATAFLPNPENKPFVDHIDGDRTNNHVSNLRWVSGKENAVYGGERHGFASQIAAAKAVAVHPARVDEYNALLAKGYSLRAIARSYNTSHSAISRAIKLRD
jgi:hypothetical protein